MPCVYILRSEKSNKYYIGSTADLGRRFVEHNRGQTRSTACGGPWVCVFIHETDTIDTAKNIELRLKRWKSKKILDQIVSSGRLVCR